MGLFSRKEKEVKLVELTQEQKDKHMMDVLNKFLDGSRYGGFAQNSKKWDDNLTKEQLAVLNDPQYSNIKFSINEFNESYNKIVDIQKEFQSNSNIMEICGIEISDFFWGTYNLMLELTYAVQSEIKELEDFKKVYNEIIEKQMKKMYYQAKCMEVILNNNVDQYDSYSESLYHNNKINKYMYLSPVSERVVKKLKVISNYKIGDNNNDINNGLKIAAGRAKDIKKEEQLKEQERSRNLNLRIQEQMFSDFRRAEEISQMIEESKKYQDSSSSISDNKTK